MTSPWIDAILPLCCTLTHLTHLPAAATRNQRRGRRTMAPNQKMSPAKAVRPADVRILPSSERAELQRRGAKAAARGDDAACNPMHDSSNMPAATGESTDIWREREAAWQKGHDVQSGAPDPTLRSPEADDGPD